MTVTVLGVPCQVLVNRVLADIAHPGEGAEGVCEQCKIVLHPVLFEPVLVWGFRDTDDFTVSRHDPQFPFSRDTFPEVVS